MQKSAKESGTQIMLEKQCFQTLTETFRFLYSLCPCVRPSILDMAITYKWIYRFTGKLKNEIK